MRTMCSPTHNAASITTGYPPANLPLSELATQMPRATFSVCSPACSPQPTVPPRGATTDQPAPFPRNNPMQIKSLATYLKTYVGPFFPHPDSSTTTAHPSSFNSFFFCYVASAARGRTASPIVDLVRCGMRCWSRVYHCQHARPRCWCICGQSTWSHSGCKGKERGRRVL